jgi:hypothetical protein
MFMKAVSAGVSTVLKTFALGIPIGVTLIDVRYYELVVDER